MAKLTSDAFEQKYPKIGPHLFNISLWQTDYKCPCCGENHMLDERYITGDLRGYRMLVMCPNGKGYMMIRAKVFMIFKFNGLEVLDYVRTDE